MTDSDNPNSWPERYFKTQIQWPAIVKTFLDSGASRKWFCVKCKHFIDDLDEYQKLLYYMESFYDHAYKICKSCRANNYFELTTDGEISFHMIDKLRG